MTSQYYAQYMKYKTKYTNLKMKMRGGAVADGVAEGEKKEQSNTSTRYLVMTKEHFTTLYNKWKQSEGNFLKKNKEEKQWSNIGYSSEKKKTRVIDVQTTYGNDTFIEKGKVCENFVDYEKKQINMPSYTLIRELFPKSSVRPYTLVINNDTENKDNQYALYEIASKADIEESIKENQEYNDKLVEIQKHEKQIELMTESNTNMQNIKEFLTGSELSECNTPNQAIELLKDKLKQLNIDKQTLRRNIISKINSAENPKLITITNNEKTDGEKILETIGGDYSIVIKYIKNDKDNEFECNTVQYIHIGTNYYPRSDTKYDMIMAILNEINFDYNKSFEKIVNMIKIHLLIKNIELESIISSYEFYKDLKEKNIDTTELFNARDAQKSENDNKHQQELNEAQNELARTKKAQQELEEIQQKEVADLKEQLRQLQEQLSKKQVPSLNLDETSLKDEYADDFNPDTERKEN